MRHRFSLNQGIRASLRAEVLIERGNASEVLSRADTKTTPPNSTPEPPPQDDMSIAHHRKIHGPHPKNPRSQTVSRPYCTHRRSLAADPCRYVYPSRPSKIISAH